MAISIVVGFVVYWIRWDIMKSLSFSAPDLPEYGIWFHDTIPYFIAYSNCAINPCICFVFSRNYRQGLKRLLKCYNTVQDRVN